MFCLKSCSGVSWKNESWFLSDICHKLIQCAMLLTWINKLLCVQRPMQTISSFLLLSSSVVTNAIKHCLMCMGLKFTCIQTMDNAVCILNKP